MHLRDDEIEAIIGVLLDARTASGSICPSEVARALESKETEWRALMPEVRRVADALVASGKLRVTRGDKDVEASAGGGPIRLRRFVQED